MGGPRYDEIAARWVAIARGFGGKRLSNERMYASADGEELYSYGSHFTLVRALRNKKRELTGFLVNGDTYSVTTTRHQSEVRQAVNRSGVPVVIIPFSALAASGLDERTVEVVDVLPDRNTTTLHRFTEPQPSWVWRDDPVYATRDKTPEELQAIVDEKNAKADEELERLRGYAIEERDRNLALGKEPTYTVWGNYLPGGKQYTREPLTVEHLSYWDTQQVRYISGYERHLYRSGHAHAGQVDVTYVGGEPIEYTYETTRHWLGESLIRAKVDYAVTRKCTDCGGFGTKPFAPDYVPSMWRDQRWKDAEVQEQAWLRRMSRCASCSSGRRVVHKKRTATFLSGFDHNETREVYFFSELPDNKATTVEEAYEALKPDTVKIAEQMGREVARQGDIFAVPMLGLDKRTLREMGARFEKRGVLLGTNHVATEVAYLKDGRTLARGTLTHAPDFRRPDHKRVTLTKGQWHLTVKNTVPLTR